MNGKTASSARFGGLNLAYVDFEKAKADGFTPIGAAEAVASAPCERASAGLRRSATVLARAAGKTTSNWSQ